MVCQLPLRRLIQLHLLRPLDRQHPPPVLRRDRQREQILVRFLGHQAIRQPTPLVRQLDPLSRVLQPVLLARLSPPPPELPPRSPPQAQQPAPRVKLLPSPIAPRPATPITAAQSRPQDLPPVPVPPPTVQVAREQLTRRAHRQIRLLRQRLRVLLLGMERTRRLRREGRGWQGR